MVSPNNSEQSQQFKKVVDGLLGIGKTICSSLPNGDLDTSIGSLSREIAELRGRVEVPTRELDGKPIIENDYYALRSFYRLNCTRKVHQLPEIDKSGRIYSLLNNFDSVKDVSPLAALTALRKLSLISNHIRDSSALSTLPLLSELSLSHNLELETQSLTKLKSIKSLSVFETGVSELDWISCLPQLRYVNLGNNKFEDIQAIATARELREVNIESNPLKSLEPLRHHPNLSKLNILRTLIEDISPLLEVPNLRILVVNRAMCGQGYLPDQLSRLREKRVRIELWDF